MTLDLAINKVCPVDDFGVHSTPQGDIAWFVVKPTIDEQLQSLLASCYGAGCAFFHGPLDLDALSLDFDRNIFIDMSLLNQVIEHERSDMVICVQTGITIFELNQYLSPFGQRFAVEAEPETRLVDIILSGDGGYLETGFGYLRSQVLGLDCIYGRGELLKSGGRVVKNVTGFDVGKLVIGSRGSFAVPYQAYLRLNALPEATATYSARSKSKSTAVDTSELLNVCSRLIADGLPLTALEIIEEQTDNQSPAKNPLYRLIVQVAGPLELVNEICGRIEFALTDLEFEKLENEDAGKIEALLNYGSATGYGVEVAASLSLMRGLMESLYSENDRGSLRVRPACGRLFLNSTDASEVERDSRLLSRLLKSCRERVDGSALANWESLVISTRCGAYRFSSRRLGAEQPALDNLINRIKNKFDPLALMNPQARFTERVG
jgi:FAD/FMN-containing dehydrogenase